MGHWKPKESNEDVLKIVFDHWKWHIKADWRSTPDTAHKAFIFTLDSEIKQKTYPSDKASRAKNAKKKLRKSKRVSQNFLQICHIGGELDTSYKDILHFQRLEFCPIYAK